MADILCLEDDDVFRTLVASVLEANGHNTLSASTIDQATALLESDKNIDLLFTDIGVQGDVEAGLKLAQDALKLRPHLAVLYTSAQAVTDGMKELFVERSAFLPKPYTEDQLAATLVVHFRLKPRLDADITIPKLPKQPEPPRDHP
jgi:DNA-binding NtrC family response regulator